MKTTRQESRNERLLRTYISAIVKELWAHISPDTAGSGRPEFAIANFSSVPELTFLAQPSSYQEMLRQQIVQSFGNRPCEIGFRTGTNDQGLIVTVKFDVTYRG